MNNSKVLHPNKAEMKGQGNTSAGGSVGNNKNQTAFKNKNRFSRNQSVAGDRPASPQKLVNGSQNNTADIISGVDKCNNNNHDHDNAGNCMRGGERRCDRKDNFGVVCNMLIEDGMTYRDHNKSGNCLRDVNNANDKVGRAMSDAKRKPMAVPAHQRAAMKTALDQGIAGVASPSTGMFSTIAPKVNVVNSQALDAALAGGGGNPAVAAPAATVPVAAAAVAQANLALGGTAHGCAVLAGNSPAVAPGGATNPPGGGSPGGGGPAPIGAAPPGGGPGGGGGPPARAPVLTGFENMNVLQWPWSENVYYRQLSWTETLAYGSFSVVSAFWWFCAFYKVRTPLAKLLPTAITMFAKPLTSASMTLQFIAYCYMLYKRMKYSWMYRPAPRVCAAVPSAALNGFLWEVQNSKITFKNMEAMLKYISNAYDAHCIRGLDKYHHTPVPLIDGYLRIKPVVVDAVAHNMSWYTDTYSNTARSFQRLNFLGAGEWRPP